MLKQNCVENMLMRHLKIMGKRLKICSKELILETELALMKNASKNKTGFYVVGLIQGTSVTWKVDTGAKNTFITEDIFNEIPPENQPVLEPARKKFVTASGQDLYVLGTAHMTLTFDDFETDLRVFVGRVSQNLLGADFYSHFRCNLDHEKGGLFLKVPAGNNGCLERTN